MSAIYIHVPFCRRRCHYCDFHFSTNTHQIDAMVEALCKEIFLRNNYLPDVHLNSIYFGGGTPSMLSLRHLHLIFDALAKYYQWTPATEITLEANPEDINRMRLTEWKSVGINRLSIGIQSFDAEKLLFMNRAHTPEEAIRCIKEAQDQAFTRLSIDLIYGLPHANHSVLEHDLMQVLSLRIPHISAYCLTIEPRTAFGKWSREKKMPLISEDFAAEQFERVSEVLLENAYEQYEISNFAQQKQYSQHNSHYWKKGAYLGIGPSAHSYNLRQRHYAISNNAQYVKILAQNQLPLEEEFLTVEDHINEYVLTSLRTVWGCDSNYIKKQWDFDWFVLHKNYLLEYENKGFLWIENGVVGLHKKGKLLADKIASDLFLISS
ncbi:MAG: radical SAM family heme chaperone HemW [Cytophagales bacterium]|nr:MAG: radical SAM family heme chaperone HemW [Cytophagales bacterium]